LVDKIKYNNCLTKGRSVEKRFSFKNNFNDVQTAVKSIQLGASDYILKPVNPDELLLAIKKALAQKVEHKSDSSWSNRQNEWFFTG